jgi:NADPH:quinone reductase-like Zn-dependent oxidoreductase
MRAYEVQEEFGIDQLKLVDKKSPEPGPNDVLIDMKAWSLNYRDLMVVKGFYNPKMVRPRIPFSDGVGEVIAVGADVSRVAVGDRVASLFAQAWIDGKPTREINRSCLGEAVEGVLAEEVVLPEQGVVKIPEHLSFEEAATLPCAGVTAWNSLFGDGQLKPGDNVLLLGTGGVSIFALQFCNMMGANVIITSSSNEKLEKAKALGASYGINYNDEPKWHKKVLECTNGNGADRVIEVGGAGTLSKSIMSAGVGGMISLIGILSGAGDVNPIPVLMNSIQIRGIFVGSRAMFENMNRAISLHQIKPVIDQVFSFENVKEALKHMESGSHFGKIVVKK